MLLLYYVPAGPPCQAHSRMGKQLGTKDVLWKTHKQFAKVVSPGYDVLVVENVPQYNAATLCAVLNRHVPQKTWRSQSVTVDPRLFGMKAARPRKYILYWKADKVAWCPQIPNLEDFVSALAADPHKSLSVHDYWSETAAASKLTTSEACGFMSRCVRFHVAPAHWPPCRRPIWRPTRSAFPTRSWWTFRRKSRTTLVVVVQLTAISRPC